MVVAIGDEYRSSLSTFNTDQEDKMNVQFEKAILSVANNNVKGGSGQKYLAVSEDMAEVLIDTIEGFIEDASISDTTNLLGSIANILISTQVNEEPYPTATSWTSNSMFNA
jgi:hypothetical protein